MAGRAVPTVRSPGVFRAGIINITFWTNQQRANAMRTVDLEDAQVHLDELIDQACSGEEFVITRAGKPVARLVSLPESRRRPGVLERKLVIPDTFFDPLPDDELDAWEQ
jgi:prevent-host-death family protein